MIFRNENEIEQAQENKSENENSQSFIYIQKIDEYINYIDEIIKNCDNENFLEDYSYLKEQIFKEKEILNEMMKNIQISENNYKSIDDRSYKAMINSTYDQLKNYEKDHFKRINGNRDRIIFQKNYCWDYEDLKK